MKVLVVTSRHRDHLASALWDGMQSVLGEDNVVDAVGCPFLHRSSVLDYLAASGERSESARRFNTAFVCQAMSGTREGRTWDRKESDFDLLVVHSCFTDDFDWSLVRDCSNYLKPAGKIAYVEGQDDAQYVLFPSASVDEVFRKEIDPAFAYPYDPVHLTFGAPGRWFDGADVPEAARDIDVFFTGNPETNGAPRWRMLSKVFQSPRQFRAVAATCGLGWGNYFAMLRRAKFALCPSTAAGSDSTRTYEAVACGAIPVFVGYPDHARDPWFPPEVCCSCATVDELPDLLDSALSGHDLSPMRKRLREWALANHTTRARALKVLTTLGFREGVDW